MFRNRYEVDNHIYELYESNCYACNTKDEVENYKNKSVVEKADLIIKNDMKHKEIMREKGNMKSGCPQYESEF